MRNSLLLILVALLSSSCMDKKSTIDDNFLGNVNTNPPTTPQPSGPFTMTLPFTAGTEGSYLFNDIAYSANLTLGLLSGKVQLKLIGQTDSEANTTATTGGFQAGTRVGVRWDNTAKYLRLDTTTNTSELDATWAPVWGSVEAYWKLNEAASATTVADSSGNNHTGSVGSNVDLAETGKLISAVAFPGMSGAEITTTTGPSISSNFTISSWVYVGSFNGTGVILRQGTTTESFSLVVEGTNNIGFIANWNDATQTHLMGEVAQNQWYHVAATYNSSDVNFYINGNLVATDPVGVKALENPSTAGISFGTYTDSSNYFYGSVDETAIWSTGLNQDQVRLIYDRQSSLQSGVLTSRVMDALSNQNWTSIAMTSTLPFYKPLSTAIENTTNYSALTGSLTTGLSTLWHLDETAGTALNDELGNLAGVLVNGPTLEAAGRFGNGITFSRATSQYISTPSTDLGNQFSISIWAKVNVISTEAHTLVSNTDSTAGFDGFRLTINSWDSTDGVVNFETGNGSIAATASTPSNLATPNEWHHYVVTVNKTGGIVGIYVDGVLQNSGSTTGLTNFNTNNALNFARSQDGFGHLDGTLDEVGVWSRLLSAGEVKQLYRRGANRVKYQVRSCSASDCSDQDGNVNAGWRGPDDSGSTYFSELYNTTGNVLNGTVEAGSPIMDFGNFSTVIPSLQYVQYRAILESDDASTTPELKSVTVGPGHYDATERTITSKAILGKAYTTLTGFQEDGTDCAGGTRFSLSHNGGASFFYHDGTGWVLSTDYATANDAPTLDSVISTFPQEVGTGTLQVKAYLKSDGETACEIDALTITGTN